MKTIKRITLLFVFVFVLLLFACESKGLQVYSLSSNKGFEEGGNTVTVFGSNFTEDITITFGKNKAIVESVSDSTVVVIVPEGDEGFVNVIVSDSEGNEIKLNKAYEYVKQEVKKVTFSGMSALSGLVSGNESLMIYGENIPSNVKVLFDDAEAIIISVSDSMISLRTPGHIAGDAVVKVVDLLTNEEYVLNDKFTYEEIVVVTEVTGLSNSTGLVAGGESVTLYGKNLPKNVSVYFGEEMASVTSSNDSIIVVIVPGNKAGIYNVKVVNNETNECYILINGYTYLSDEKEIVISSISISEGNVNGGDTVVIYGYNFPNQLKVYFNDNTAEVKYISDSLVVVVSPKGEEGVASIVFEDTLNNKKATLDNAFKYVKDKTVIELTGLSVSSGLTNGGESVTVYGKNLSNNVKVYFDNSLAKIVSNNENVIVVETPVHKSGVVDVKVVVEDSNEYLLENSYTYLDVEDVAIELYLNPGVDTIEINSEFIDAGVVAKYGNITLPVTVTSNVDITTNGTYYVTYEAEYETKTASITRMVVVTDEVAPVITLNLGVDTVMINTAWVDSGATAIDNSKEHIECVASGNVDTSKAGTYLIKYTAVDSKGNVSVKTRYVTVIENND